MSKPDPSEATSLLDRWNHSGLPSVQAFNHAVEVANANFQRAHRLAQRVEMLETALREITEMSEFELDEVVAVAYAALTGEEAHREG